jgi:hypothetical protein
MPDLPRHKSGQDNGQAAMPLADVERAWTQPEPPGVRTVLVP